jgi:hypothetical protein
MLIVARYLFLIPQPGNWDSSKYDYFYRNLQVNFHCTNVEIENVEIENFDTPILHTLQYIFL